MHKFNESLSYDRVLWSHDIRGSIAYANANVATGILTPSERDQIISGLQAVAKEWEAGTFVPAPDDEDIHTANERRLTELIGPVAGKLHTGRSRNDQVATDVRLYVEAETEKIEQILVDLIKVMAARAKVEVDAVMPVSRARAPGLLALKEIEDAQLIPHVLTSTPSRSQGYTHLQRAQPIRWSHFLLSHASSLLTDLSRLRSMRPRISVLPLGSGPLAGNPFAGLDRDAMAKELGFKTVGMNSMHSVSDRDFIVEFLFWASLTMVHISRLAEDLIIYSTSEFGFVQLSDAYR